VQIDEIRGVIVAPPGYVSAAPAWRRDHGVVYTPNGTDRLAQLPPRLRALLLELGEQTHEQMHQPLDTDEPVPVGERTDTIKLLVLRQIRDGVPYEQVLAFNRERCTPPLDGKDVVKNVDGLFGWAAPHPPATVSRRCGRGRSVGSCRG
jgi:hypothetical protein